MPHCYEELKDDEKWKPRDGVDDEESNKRKRTIDLDDDDESTGAHKQLMPEKNKQLIPSEQAGALMRVVIEGIDEVNETMHDGDQNSQIVPYSPSATLVNQYPVTSYQPSAVLFERVILQKRPEEERIHDLAVCTFHLQFFTESYIVVFCSTCL
mgnify:CR=1 FL=1